MGWSSFLKEIGEFRNWRISTMTVYETSFDSRFWFHGALVVGPFFPISDIGFAICTLLVCATFLSPLWLLALLLPFSSIFMQFSTGAFFKMWMKKCLTFVHYIVPNIILTGTNTGFITGSQSKSSPLKPCHHTGLRKGNSSSLKCLGWTLWGIDTLVYTLHENLKVNFFGTCPT